MYMAELRWTASEVYGGKGAEKEQPTSSQRAAKEQRQND